MSLAGLPVRIRARASAVAREITKAKLPL